MRRFGIQKYFCHHKANLGGREALRMQVITQVRSLVSVRERRRCPCIARDPVDPGRFGLAVPQKEAPQRKRSRYRRPVSSGALQGQVSVWVPIVVGILGMVGVISGQLVSAWREQRRENIRWLRERKKEELQQRREDYRHWRDKRLEVAVALMISLNKWRELIVDRLREHHGLIDGYDDTREQLRDVVEETSDLMAQLKLVGTDTMRTMADETVNLFRTRFSSAMHSSGQLSSDEVEQVSRELSLKRRDLQEAVRSELGVELQQIG